MRRSGLLDRYGEFRGTWRTLSLYERFEQTVALILTALIALVTAIATWDLARAVVRLLWAHRLDSLDPELFQGLFSQIMLLLIALEFKHSILRGMAHRASIVQVRTVVLIAILAIARKFIILDADHHAPSTIIALAAVIGTLGLTYWLIRDRESKRTQP